INRLLDDSGTYDLAVAAHVNALVPFDNEQFTRQYLEILARTTGHVASFADVLADVPPAPSQPRAARVAAVVDEFTRDCLQPELDLIHLTPDNWRDVLADVSIDFVFIESAWVGQDGCWARKVAYEGGRATLYALIDFAKSKSLPVVFWNKEDPMHYDLFLGVARRSDYVFTTDAECIERYRRDIGHAHVYPLPFAAQPAIHNPMGKSERDGLDILFAGSWYERFPERNAFLDALLPALTQRGFHLYDRHFWNPNPEMKFPARYHSHIFASLPYVELLRAIKQYKLVLNVNTVVTSSTMCARRPFEVSAAATPVVSNSAKALDALLPGLIFQADNAPQMQAMLSELLEDQHRRLRAGHAAWRFVMEHHTYAHRVVELLKTIGIGRTHEGPTWPSVSVRTLGRSDFAGQDYPGAIDIAAVSTEPFDAAACAGAATGDLMVLCASSQRYEPQVVKDLVLALRYAPADVVGKCAPTNGSPDYARAWRFIEDGAMPIFAVPTEKLRTMALPLRDGGLAIDQCRRDTRIYACDPFGVVS
ncbi:MAG: glycosyltransferase, partial [Myxococcota bacterium]